MELYPNIWLEKKDDSWYLNDETDGKKVIQYDLKSLISAPEFEKIYEAQGCFIRDGNVWVRMPSKVYGIELRMPLVELINKFEEAKRALIGSRESRLLQTSNEAALTLRIQQLEAENAELKRAQLEASETPQINPKKTFVFGEGKGVVSWEEFSKDWAERGQKIKQLEDELGAWKSGQMCDTQHVSKAQHEIVETGLRRWRSLLEGEVHNLEKKLGSEKREHTHLINIVSQHCAVTNAQLEVNVGEMKPLRELIDDYKARGEKIEAFEAKSRAETDFDAWLERVRTAPDFAVELARKGESAIYACLMSANPCYLVGSTANCKLLGLPPVAGLSQKGDIHSMDVARTTMLKELARQMKQ